MSDRLLIDDPYVPNAPDQSGWTYDEIMAWRERVIEDHPDLVFIFAKLFRNDAD